jgi:DNA-binding transcriptional LysR family regulator
MEGGRQLPPLNALVVFEAAARLGNFSRAGGELGLTQSAVSRQIGKLEAFIGSKLFTRTPHGVVLTSVGETYAIDIGRILGELGGVTDGMRAWTGARQVTIACSLGIADLWIMPRLKALKAEFPDIELRLRVTDDIVHLRLDEFDLAIFYRAERPTGVALTVLGREEIVPVAAPSSPKLIDKEEPVLISIEDPMREWFDWPEWSIAAGMNWPDKTRRWKLGDYRLVAEAASQGLGVALGWTWLIQDQLASGTLVPIHEYRMHTEGRFYLMRPSDRHQRKIVRQVSDWLVTSNGGPAE